jgi:hypothetical protein
MPIRSFTAPRIRCLQPRSRSVVWCRAALKTWTCDVEFKGTFYVSGTAALYRKRGLLHWNRRQISLETSSTISTQRRCQGAGPSVPGRIANLGLGLAGDYRIKKRWPYSPYGTKVDKRIERRELAAVYGLRPPLQTPIQTFKPLTPARGTRGRKIGKG